MYYNGEIQSRRQQLNKVTWGISATLSQNCKEDFKINKYTTQKKIGNAPNVILDLQGAKVYKCAFWQNYLTCYLIRPIFKKIDEIK